MKNIEDKTEKQYTTHYIKRSFWHNVKRIIGGEYYEAKTDTTYWYFGEIKLWVHCKWYNVKKWFLLRWYDLRIWCLKIRMKRKKLIIIKRLR